MIKLFTYRSGKVKISYNEKLTAEDEYDDVRCQQVNVKTYPIFDSFSLGIEIAVHTGGRYCYGKLVAQVQPENEKNGVYAAVNYIKKNRVKYKESLLLDDRYVYQGLPEEYLDEVVKRIPLAISKKENYPQAKILFTHAANCEVGSSPYFFGRIAELLIAMIPTVSCEDICAMDIQTFTDKYMKAAGLCLAYDEVSGR